LIPDPHLLLHLLLAAVEGRWGLLDGFCHGFIPDF
jgi:hypothetical protein